MDDKASPGDYVEILSRGNRGKIGYVVEVNENWRGRREYIVNLGEVDLTRRTQVRVSKIRILSDEESAPYKPSS